VPIEVDGRNNAHNKQMESRFGLKNNEIIENSYSYSYSHTQDFYCNKKQNTQDFYLYADAVTIQNSASILLRKNKKFRTYI
jgi:hypothetical protein